MMSHPYQSSPDEPPAAAIPVEELLRAFMSRADELLMAEERTRGLLEAVVTVAGELSLETVLKRVVDSACQLLHARYGALGVIGEDSTLSHFVTVGIDQELAERIGPLPTGHGVLGLLITGPAPLRLHDLRQHPKSYGFPAHHPPMKSFLGVPIRVRDAVFGNLYLTEKEGGEDFTPEDEDLAVALAAAAGVAIENARLYEDAQRRASWLEACMDATGYLLEDSREDHTEHAAFHIVAEAAARVTDGRVAVALAPADRKGTYTVAAAVGRGARDLRGRKLTVGPSGLKDIVLTGRSIAMDDSWNLLGPAVQSSPANLLAVDLSAQGTHYGLLISVREPGSEAFAQTDVEMSAVFGSHIALALALDRIRRYREESVVSSDRDRIARDLHDLVIQRLFAAGLSIQSLRRYTPAPEAPDRIDAITDQLDSSIRDLRNTIYSLRAAAAGRQLLSSRVVETVQSASAALPFAPHLTLIGALDVVEDEIVIEHLLAVISEALSNAARHSDAQTINVTVGVTSDALTAEVSDDGRGFSHPGSGNGLANMAKRAADLNGSCAVTSSPGDGTSIIWSVPLR